MTEDAKKKRKKKLNGYTTLGNPELDIERFNSAFTGFTDTSAAPVDCAGVNMSMGADSGSSSAGTSCGESLELAEKRETKRYYVRPQDIFCANKNDVLKALIDVANANENCTVYSLKNLDDHDDVGKLTSHDIIYYYDENVLYDKNHELVMDYDLFIKHEEERKKFANMNAVSKQEYKDEYSDRMTKETVVESLSIDGLKLALDKGEKLYLGTNSEDVDKWIRFNDGAPYSNTEYYLSKENDKYIVESVYMSADGEMTEGEEELYDTLEEVSDVVKSLNLTDCQFEIINNTRVEDRFNQEFESFNLNKTYKRINEDFDDVDETCVICGEEIRGYGNNAEPYKKGRCCDACNLKFVIPARIEQMRSSSLDNEDQE